MSYHILRSAQYVLVVDDSPKKNLFNLKFQEIHIKIWLGKEDMILFGVLQS
jgi:hypothetical protein